MTSGKFKTGLEAKGFVEIQLNKQEDPKRPRVWTHPAVWGDRGPATQSNQTKIAGTGTPRSAPELALEWELDLTCKELEELEQCTSRSHSAIPSPLVVIPRLVKLINDGRARRSCTSSSASSSTQVRPSSTSGATPVPAPVPARFPILDPEAPI